MKKTLAFLLSLGLTVSMLAGCGSKTNETTAATDAQTESAAGTEKSTADDDAAATTMHWMLPTKDFSQHWMTWG